MPQSWSCHCRLLPGVNSIGPDDIPWIVWARDVRNRVSQANQQQTWAGSITDVGHQSQSLHRLTAAHRLHRVAFEGKATAGVDYDGSRPARIGSLLQP